MTADQVILLDEEGNRIGVHAKAHVHHRNTPLHLAFSCYVFDTNARLLLTRRALTKQTWPGVWTNSCCGHPLADEPIDDAVVRRLKDELGLAAVGPLELRLPRFRYRATMADGVVENEICPVFSATVDTQPTPNPAEVGEFLWLPWQDFAGSVLDGTRDVSPWCRLQVTELDGLGPDPLSWPRGHTADLPPAARLTL
ncbi:isopentenyl-diphosphate Delta-isomerase [Planosporangium mesophilum]|uniref:isopentenyl-diphosphate Delta-isomerase n=1 Tax=Planosporangium mesophilum TaxID=689768 RepID=UPI00143A7394|nr:isopentenyl-diphosphate Delta-isomerase [Planosporangium mesophilum]NJC83136.1 isopentenyl-diphosphate Delta-isomerase [Planosporangium mesophilum]